LLTITASGEKNAYQLHNFFLSPAHPSRFGPNIPEYPVLRHLRRIQHPRFQWWWRFTLWSGSKASAFRRAILLHILPLR